MDAAGSAYVTGEYRSADFPTTAGAFDTTWNGGNVDAFVTKLNPAGTALVYSTYLGGSGERLRQRHRAWTPPATPTYRRHRLGRLPDDGGRLRHDLQRRLPTPS